MEVQRDVISFYSQQRTIIGCTNKNCPWNVGYDGGVHQAAGSNIPDTEGTFKSNLIEERPIKIVGCKAKEKPKIVYNPVASTCTVRE